MDTRCYPLHLRRRFASPAHPAEDGRTTLGDEVMSEAGFVRRGLRDLVVTAVSLFALGIAPAQASGLMIQNVTIIDPITGATPHQDVLIGNETIGAIGDTGSIATFAPVDTIDGTGKFLIPALWDAHVHLTYDPEIGNRALALFVANGITRVRDTGGLLDKMIAVRDFAQAQGSRAPDIYFAGPLIDGVPRVYDGTPARFPEISIGAATPAQAEAHVDQLAEAGASLIKAYEMLRPDTFRALVTRATAHGLPVTAHIPLGMSLQAVAATGIRGMEHLRNIGLACSSEADRLLEERKAMLQEGASEEGSALRSHIHGAQRPVAFTTQNRERCATVIATLADARIFQTPTLALNTRGAFRQFLRPEWREQVKYLPATVTARWNRAADKAKDTPISPAYAGFADWSLSMVGQLHEADVPIMAGTDTPIGLLTPGFSLHLEMEMLVRAGLTPQEALASATLRPAEFFGLEGEMGSIEVGKSSDLVLLNANPLENIENTQQIESVIIRGEVLTRAQLDQLLEQPAN